MPNQFNVSIWGDEGFSAVLSMKSIPEILKIIATDTSPPLWNLTEHLAFNAFGISEATIRGLAFIYFILTVFFVYKIGTLLWNRKTGLISAALTFLNPFFFIYAFEGRMYSILALGVTSSMYFFLRFFYKEEGQKLSFIGYIIASLWAMYSHHFAIFALFIQGLWFLYEFIFGRRGTAKKIFKAFIFIGIGYLPWMIPLYNQTKMVGGGFWLGTPTLRDLGFLITEYIALGIRNSGLSIPLVDIAFYEVAIVISFTIFLIRKWGNDVKKTIFLLSWFLGPILITWFVSQQFQSIFFNRYLLYAIPGAMLVLGSNTRKYSLMLIGVLLTLFLVIDYDYFTHPIKLPFREMSEYVKQTRLDGDLTINWNSSAHHLWETKFYGFDSPIFVQGDGELPFFVGTALMEDRDIIHKIPDNVNRVGVVTSGSIEEVQIPEFGEENVKELNRLKFIWLTREKK